MLSCSCCGLCSVFHSVLRMDPAVNHSLNMRWGIRAACKWKILLLFAWCGRVPSEAQHMRRNIQWDTDARCWLHASLDCVDEQNPGVWCQGPAIVVYSPAFGGCASWLKKSDCCLGLPVLSLCSSFSCLPPLRQPSPVAFVCNQTVFQSPLHQEVCYQEFVFFQNVL